MHSARCDRGWADGAHLVCRARSLRASLRFGRSALRRSRPSWASRLRDGPANATCAIRPGTMVEIKKDSPDATKPCKLPYTVSISVRIDLRLSSPTFIGQNGVELRIGASFKIPLRFRFASSHFSRRRASHCSPAFVASGVNASYGAAPPRARGRAPEMVVVHKNFQFCTSTHINPRNPQARQSRSVSRTALFARESICACPCRVIVGQDGVELRRHLCREHLAARPSSSPPTCSQHSAPSLAKQGALSTVSASGSQAPRYAATTSRWVASSAPVPVRTMRPRSIT